MNSLSSIGALANSLPAGGVSAGDSTRQLTTSGVGAPAGSANGAPTGLAAGAASQSSGVDSTAKGKGANAKELQNAVDKVSQVVGLYTTKLSFSIDNDTKAVVVKVINEQNDEVIRQIPSEEMLKLAKSLDNIVGLFVKNTA